MCYITILNEHLYPMMQHFFLAEKGVFQGNAPVHRAQVVTRWFEEYEDEVTHLTWPSRSPDLNPIELLGV